LSEAERRVLNNCDRRRKTTQGLTLQARIVLACAGGRSKIAVRRRAEQVDPTRQRIVEAAVECTQRRVGYGHHRAIGDRAGVTWLTVYRHFADDAACSARAPRPGSPSSSSPTPAAWSQIGEPSARLQADLADLYRFFRASADMLTCVYRDFAALPEEHRQALRDQDALFRDVPPHRSAASTTSTAGCALASATRSRFWTWRSLCLDHSLTDTEAVDAMTGMVLNITPEPQAEPAQ
jgi:AcrR family transcriptional regulator